MGTDPAVVQKQPMSAENVKRVAIAGHVDGFRREVSEWPGAVLKKTTPEEHTALKELAATSLKDYVAKYHGKAHIDGVEYAVMSDLIIDFDADQTHIMDVKMGKRTFMESEVTNKKKRMDLLQKMVKAKPGEATEEEMAEGITKQRYQEFREKMSTSAALGFRVDAMGIPEGNGKSVPAEKAKKIGSRAEVEDCFRQFLAGRADCWAEMLGRLKELRETLDASEWFAAHELVGSSILFSFDMAKNGKAACGVWIIDLAHALPSETKLSHRADWVEGNHEEGYLTGLDNLISVWEGLNV